MWDEGGVHILCWACFSPREGEEESPHSVSLGTVFFGALAQQDVTSCCVLPEVTKLMEGAGMKGCSILEIKVTNSKAFVLRLILVVF